MYWRLSIDNALILYKYISIPAAVPLSRDNSKSELSKSSVSIKSVKLSAFLHFSFKT